MTEGGDRASIDSAVNQDRCRKAMLEAPLLTMDLLRTGIEVVEQRRPREKRRPGY